MAMQRAGQDIRLVIGVPSGSSVNTSFFLCLLQLVLVLQNPIPGVRSILTRVHNTKGSILARSRQGIIDAALKNNATHVLFIDSDQTFPANTFQQLFRRGKKVIAANVATKSIPAMPTARAKSEDFWGIPIQTKENDIGCEQVWRIGTGIMLIDLSIFEGKKWPQPIFSQRWVEEIQDYSGEDWGFCEWLDSQNIPIFVDHKLSWQIGHIGEFEYTHFMVE